MDGRHRRLDGPGHEDQIEVVVVGECIQSQRGGDGESGWQWEKLGCAAR